MNYPEYDKIELYLSEKDGDHSYYEFSEFISQLIEREILDNDTENGIVKLVASRGTKILSEKQGKVLERIVNRFDNEECKLCSTKIPLNEVLDLDYNKGFCIYHKNQFDKNND